MNRKEEAIKRAEFRDIIDYLAKTDDLIKDKKKRYNLYKKIEALYIPNEKGESFHHYYSDVFSRLIEINVEPSLGSLETLLQNIDIIYNGYKPQKSQNSTDTINASDNIRKLYDHIQLDVGRIRYSDTGDRELGSDDTFKKVAETISRFENIVTITEENVKEAKKISESAKKTSRDARKIAADASKHAKKAAKKLANSQKENVAILGIFAAVVLAFTGGIAFSTSVLNNIHHATIYRLIIISSIIGLVLYNIIHVLLFNIKNIIAMNEKEKPVLKNELSFWLVNGLIALLILGTSIAWRCGFAEKRNINVNCECQEILAVTPAPEPTPNHIFDPLTTPVYPFIVDKNSKD